MSLVCFAQYYIYDSVTPLKTMIQDQLHFTSADYGLLFSAYSFPHVFLFMVLLAGILVDKMGLKKSGIFYTFLCFLGAFLTAFAASGKFSGVLGESFYNWLHSAFLPGWSPELKIMLLGRAIYGIGAEAVLVVNNKVLARWFKGKELAFAYGLNLTIMRLGTFLALNLQAQVGSRVGLIQALWVATVIMGAGFILFFVYLGIEKMALKKVSLSREDVEGSEDFRLRDIFRFSASFWFITFLCVTFYSAVFPFQAFAPDIIMQKFGATVKQAGFYTSMLIFGTMIFTPIFGWLVDRKGKRATMMIFGSLLIVPCHIILGFTHMPPVIPIFCVGIALSLVPAALWAAIPLMVDSSRLGTAFGIVGWVQNLGLFLFPLIAGKIADAHTTWGMENGVRVPLEIDYSLVMIVFASLGFVGFAFSLLLKRADSRRKEGTFSIEDVALH